MQTCSNLNARTRSCDRPKCGDTRDPPPVRGASGPVHRASSLGARAAPAENDASCDRPKAHQKFSFFFPLARIVGAAHRGEPGNPPLPIYGTESACSSAFREFWGFFSAGSSKPAGRRRGPFARRFSGVLQSSAAAKTAFANASQSSCGYSPERTVRFPCLGPPFTIGSQTQVFSRVRSSGALESSTVGFIIGKFWNFRP